MTDRTCLDDRTGARDRSAARAPRAGEPVVLRLTVAEYEERPDRATIHPEGLAGVERMATWLSADRSAFVDLAAHR